MLSLILGLGNIGKKYQQTRHNLGFEVIDRIVEKLGAVRQEDTALFEWWKVEVAGEDARHAQESPFDSAQGVVVSGDDTAHGDVRRARTIYLAKPTTNMNRSGEAAKELIERLGITPTEILVVVDDFQISLGAIRFRLNGSDGGHNGLVSVIEELGTQVFPRLRLGIGTPTDKGQVVDYVLSKFSKQEQPNVEKMLAVAAEGVIFGIRHRLEMVMSKYNCNPASTDLA